MNIWFDHLRQLIQPWWPHLLGATIVLTLISLLLIPLLLVLLPDNHFVAEKPVSRRHPLMAATLWGLRNLFALLLFVAGFLMLFLPGQGLLTLFLAVALADLPGKQRLERALLRRPLIFHGANWIRKRYHRPPFIHPDAASHAD